VSVPKLSDLLDSHFETQENGFKCLICKGPWREYLDMYLKKAQENPHRHKKTDLEAWFGIVAKQTGMIAPSSSRVGECLRRHIPEEWSRACGESKQTSPEKSPR